MFRGGGSRTPRGLDAGETVTAEPPGMGNLSGAYPRARSMGCHGLLTKRAMVLFGHVCVCVCVFVVRNQETKDGLQSNSVWSKAQERRVVRVREHSRTTAPNTILEF